MIIWLLSVLFFLALPCFSQETEQDTLVPPSSEIRFEFPDDEYIPVPSIGRQTSPAYRFSTTEIFTVQVNVTESGENIIDDAANEPTIAVDPTDPARMAIGWRQFDTIHSNFRQAGWGYTTDSGQTWTFPGVIEPGIFRSDPVLDYDAEGNFFYNSLTDDWICDVFKSTDGGATWDAGTFAQGGDKQWMAIDRTTGIGSGNIYAYWNGYYSVCSPGNFTRSTDAGLSYEDCLLIQEEPYWGVLTVGNDGELYVCGASDNNFIVLKSTNAQDSSQTVTWDLSTTVSLGGEIWSGEGPNPGGLLGQAWIAVDHSSGPTRGNVYLLCSVNPSTSNDPLEVMFSSSTDGGATWSPPVRVNDDPGSNAWQWFGTMSVAPDGRIDVVWLDTRDAADYNSALYYSYSRDAGVTWSENERLSESFDPHVGWPQQQKMGDYFHMISDLTGAHLAWAATFNGEQDVYYSRISVPIDECWITVTSPYGGETWCVGESENITWTSENTSGNVKIEYSTNGGSGWQTVVASTPDDGTHPWTVPNTPSTNCLVKICDVSDPGCCDQSNSTFTICDAIQANFSGNPTTGEGHTCSVQFTDQSSGCVTGWSWDFGDGGTSDQQNPSHIYDCNGSYTVSLTVLGPCDSDTETKQNYITCECPCQITVTSPDGGETWCVGESEDITWTSGNTSGNVKIEYSTNGGSSWQTEVASTPDDGTHPWTVPNTPSTSCLVRICDVSDPVCCDQNNSTFQICECWTIEITTESLPDGTEGCPYNETVDVTGGCRPYSWSIVSGALPDSMDLDNSSGVISGKPNEVGTFDFTVLVEDVLGDTDEKEFSIQIGEYANIKGDVNADCAINVVDVVFDVNIILELTEPTQDQIWRADCNGLPGNCNGDGTINILDAIKIVNLILGLDECP